MQGCSDNGAALIILWRFRRNEPQLFAELKTLGKIEVSAVNYKKNIFCTATIPKFT
jgi:hypothetical protein